jgi:hypothetical protein
VSVLATVATALFLSAALAVPPTQNLHAKIPQESSVLSDPVKSFQVENSTIEDALRTLRQKDFARILIGFQKVARSRSEKVQPLSLSLSNATVGQILDQLCQQSGEYTYGLIDSTIIHVRPAHAKSDPSGLLDLRISEFLAKGTMLPAALIVRIADLAPELTSYMGAKKSEYYAGRSAMPVSPGAIGQGNMDPKINLDLKNMTVREILNAIVLYSVQLRNQTPADSHGYKLPTASWLYEFVVDPTAPTGLGGTPRWIAF